MHRRRRAYIAAGLRPHPHAPAYLMLKPLRSPSLSRAALSLCPRRARSLSPSPCNHTRRVKFPPLLHLSPAIVRPQLRLALRHMVLVLMPTVEPRLLPSQHLSTTLFSADQDKIPNNLAVHPGSFRCVRTNSDNAEFSPRTCAAPRPSSVFYSALLPTQGPPRTGALPRVAPQRPWLRQQPQLARINAMKHSSYPTEDDGADNLTPVDPGPEFASQTNFHIHGGTEDIAIYQGFQPPHSGVVLTFFLRGDVLHRFEYGVPTVAFLAKLRRGTCTTGRPDLPDATMHRAKYLLHDNDFADELGREEADLDVKLLGPVRYCATSDQLVIECKALLDARLVFEEMPSKAVSRFHSDAARMQCYTGSTGHGLHLQNSIW
ncbi:uncharacterized protein [Miscanthus floridulus]|uniref:uncharacterized protein n=1 Tax=Miscanthus floridulus TaxID=154761 RepID=UPI003459072F